MNSEYKCLMDRELDLSFELIQLKLSGVKEHDELFVEIKGQLECVKNRLKQIKGDNE